MYERFYGLTEKPFSIIPNPDRFFLAAKHRLALAHLEYGISEGAGFVLLTGEIGSGKTTLLRRVFGNLGPDADVAMIFNTAVTGAQLLRLTVQEFGQDPTENDPALAAQGCAPPATMDKAAILETLNRLLIERFAARRRSILVIDEAQNLSKEALEEVRMLSNLQTETQPLLQIVLAGQPELRAKIRHPALEQLAQRITVSFHLGALAREEVGEYVAYRMQAAGAARRVFTDEAIEVVADACGGIPRAINILCDMALVYGYADSADTVGPEIVRQALSDREGTDAVAGAEERQSEAAQESGSARGLRMEQASQLEDRILALETLTSRLCVRLDAFDLARSGPAEQDALRMRDARVAELEAALEVERAKFRKIAVHCRGLQTELARVRSQESFGADVPDAPIVVNGVRESFWKRFFG